MQHTFTPQYVMAWCLIVHRELTVLGLLTHTLHKIKLSSITVFMLIFHLKATQHLEGEMLQSKHTPQYKQYRIHYPLHPNTSHRVGKH